MKKKKEGCSISTVPKLLTLCKECLTNLQGRKESDPGILEEKLKAAIKKAEGRRARRRVMKNEGQAVSKEKEQYDLKAAREK